MKIILETLSPLCPGMGEGDAGIIDTEIPVDAYGFPVIPAKRIKGRLLQCFDELAQYDPVKYNKQARNRIFGKSGEMQGALTFDNGHPVNHHALVRSLQRLKSIEHTAMYFHPEAVKNYYSFVHAQTAIDRISGSANPKSLRSIRAIHPGFRFEFRIEVIGKIESSDLDLLADCVKVMRHMGLQRTRGFGWVRCRLDPSHVETVRQRRENETNLDDHKVYRLPFKIELDTPVIFQEDYIPGTALLGAFSSLYMRSKGLGISDDMSKDRTFRDIFLQGKVIFRHGYPGSADFPWQRSVPTSAIWMRMKDVEKKLFIPKDVFDCNGDSPVEGGRMAQAERGFYLSGADGSNKIRTVETARELNYHHQRPANKRIGHALGTEHAQGGELFVYEAMAPNSVFIAGLEGSGRDLKVLMTLAEQNRFRISIGRSSTAQYGQATISFGAAEELQEVSQSVDIGAGQVFGIVLTSPAVIPNQRGFTDCTVNTLTSALLTELKKYQADQVEPSGPAYCRFTTFGGYNAKWKLPKASQAAYDSGTVVLFKNKGKDAVRLPIGGRIGLHTNVGYGEYAVDLLKHETLEIIEEITSSNISKVQGHDGLVKVEPAAVDMIHFILSSVLHRKLTLKAIQDADDHYERLVRSKDVSERSSESHRTLLMQLYQIFRKGRQVTKDVFDCVQLTHQALQLPKLEKATYKDVFGNIFDRNTLKEKTEAAWNEMRVDNVAEWEPREHGAFIAYYEAYFNQLKNRLKLEKTGVNRR